MKIIQSVALSVTIGMAANVATAEDTFVGISLTSDYIGGNIRQNAGKPALQGYFETNLDNGLYFGTWTSMVDFSAFGSTDNAEIELYAGYRGKAGKLNYDLSYYRYYYDQSGFNSDEVYLNTNYEFSDKLKAGAKVHYFASGALAHEWLYGPTFTFAFSDKTALDGTVNFLTANNDINWDLGLRQQLTDTLSVKATYYGSNTDDGKIAAALSWDTSINALFK